MKPGLRILIIEDSEDDAILVLHQIKKGGYEADFVRVETAEKMSDMLKEKSWDIILSDYMMPHFTGLDALLLLKESGLDIPFIIISGTIGEDVAVEAMKAGAHDYIMKSNLQRLLPAIERELRESESRASRKKLELKQKLAEEELHRSNEMLRVIFESAPTPIFDLDLEGNVKTVWNPAAEKLLGWKAGEVLGHLLPTRAKENQADLKIFRDQIRNGLTLNGLEEKQEKRDGTPVDYCIYASPLFDREGHISGNVEVLMDITERKQAELEIARMNRVLRMLSHSNQALIHLSDETTLLNEVCRIAVEIGGYQMAWVGFTEPTEKKTLRTVAHAGFDLDYIEPVSNSWTDNQINGSPCFVAISTGHPVIERNPNTDKTIAPWWEEAIQYGSKSLIALPLINEDYTFGALKIFSNDADAFDEKEVDILKELTDDLSFGINSIIIRDKKKQAEKALLESEERFRLIAENTADTITVMDLNLNTVYASPSIFKLRGYTVQESLNQTLNQILTPDSLLKAKKIFSDQMELEAIGNADPSRTESFEVEEYCKDGSIIWVEIAVSFIRDANLKPLQILAVTRDITQRKRSEKDLRILSRAVEQSPVSILITDTTGKIEYVNSKFTEVTGFTKEEVLGQNPRVLKSGEMTPDYYKQMWQAITTGKEWYGEFHNRKKNGELYWELVSISPIVNKTGSITQFLAVKEDITERKQTERELIFAKEKAEESDRLKTSFLCNMSHEIRTPMNAIIGFSQFMCDPDFPMDEKKHFSTIIKDRSFDLLRIVEDILDISKIEVGQMQIIDLDVNLENLMNEIYEYYRLKMTISIPKQPLTFNVSLDSNLKNTILKIDGQRLKQILNNLLDNAFKFTKEGNIDFDCKMVSSTELQFTIRDTGIGIPEDKREIIFDRFRQAEDLMTARSYGGTGLGLSIVKGLVSLMNGKIRLESQVNAGTCFYVTLPLKRSGIAYEDNHLHKNLTFQASSWINKTILIVEDDTANSEYLNLALSGKGLRILMAFTGKEALQIIKEQPNIDLILMDIRLPDTNGLDLTRKIKENNANTFIIAQTAFAFSNDIQDCIDAGCNDYISKPINTQKLILKIDHFLNLKH